MEATEHATVAKYTTRISSSRMSKRCWNGSVSSRPGEQLNAGLHDPQLLQQARPIAVQPLRFGFGAGSTIPLLIILGVVDIHILDHRTSQGAPETGVRAGCSGYAATMQTPGLIVLGQRTRESA